MGVVFKIASSVKMAIKGRKRNGVIIWKGGGIITALFKMVETNACVLRWKGFIGLT